MYDKSHSFNFGSIISCDVFRFIWSKFQLLIFPFILKKWFSGFFQDYGKNWNVRNSQSSSHFTESHHCYEPILLWDLHTHFLDESSVESNSALYNQHTHMLGSPLFLAVLDMWWYATKLSTHHMSWLKWVCALEPWHLARMWLEQEGA